jgi:hypothetical protein
MKSCLDWQLKFTYGIHFFAMSQLNAENYQKGFLVDDHLMAGITADPEQPGTYIAFVLRHTTGEYLGYQPFTELEGALQAINQIQRTWTFEKLGGCGGCGEGGGCSGGGCGAGKCGQGACPV